MDAGFSRVCVNPPVGVRMQGLWQHRGCETIRDDIFVQALFAQQGGTAVVIIGCDLLFFDRPVADAMRDAVAGEVGITADQVLLNCTHNHAGPATGSWGYQQQPDEDYLERVRQAMVDAAVAARAGRVEASIEIGMTHCALPVSRRFVDETGQAQWRPAPNAEICDAVPVCVLRDPGGRVLSLLYSASCHPSTWYEAEICGDFPGVATRMLNDQFSTEGALFLQGCAGDTKPCTIADDAHWRTGSWQDVEAAATLVADAVADALRGGLTQAEPAIRVETIELEFPLDVAPAAADFEALANDPDTAGERQAWAREMLEWLARDGALPTTAPIRLQLLQLGTECRLVALECEPVGEIGNLILSVFDHGVTFPLGYTNGTQLYLPTDRMLPEHGYEVDSYWEYHWPAPLTAGIDRRLREGLQRLKQR